MELSTAVHMRKTSGKTRSLQNNFVLSPSLCNYGQKWLYTWPLNNTVVPDSSTLIQVFLETPLCRRQFHQTKPISRKLCSRCVRGCVFRWRQPTLWTPWLDNWPLCFGEGEGPAYCHRKQNARYLLSDRKNHLCQTDNPPVH